MSVTLTLHAWYLLAYLAVGAVSYWPLALHAWHNTNERSSFYGGTFVGFITNRGFRWPLRKRAWRVVRNFSICCLLWPLAAWGELR